MYLGPDPTHPLKAKGHFLFLLVDWKGDLSACKWAQAECEGAGTMWEVSFHGTVTLN